VEDVLDADRNAVQRAAILAARQLVVQPACLGEGAVASDEDPGAGVLLPAIDVREALLHEIDGGDSFLPNGVGGLVDGLHGGRMELTMEPFDPDRLVQRGVECVFSCLPHGASASAVAPVVERGMRVIDLSADYRLRDPALFLGWYGEPQHDPENLKHAVYGLPELYADSIRAARLVANPGCYPQTAILGLAPLVAHQLVDLHE